MTNSKSPVKLRINPKKKKSHLSTLQRNGCNRRQTENLKRSQIQTTPCPNSSSRARRSTRIFNKMRKLRQQRRDGCKVSRGRGCLPSPHTPRRSRRQMKMLRQTNRQSQQEKNSNYYYTSRRKMILHGSLGIQKGIKSKTKSKYVDTFKSIIIMSYEF